MWQFLDYISPVSDSADDSIADFVRASVANRRARATPRENAVTVAL